MSMFFLFSFKVCYVLNILFMCTYVWEIRVKLIIGLRWAYTPFWPLMFWFCLFLLTYDAVMLAKKQNVKSCIIYEICIKEKCNSIINKILIQFLEQVVHTRLFFLSLLRVIWLMGYATCVYKKHFQGLDCVIWLSLALVLPVQDIL